MVIVLWTVKAGAGCTAAALGVALGHGRGESVLLVDLGGDIPAAAGLAEPGVGLTDWLASSEPHPEALSRIEVGIGSSVSLLPTGSATTWPETTAELFAELIGHEGRRVVIDAGYVGDHGSVPMDSLRRRLIRAADRSVLVSRPCYLALRRIAGVSEPIDSMILVRDQARSLDRGDVLDVVGIGEIFCLDAHPSVARAIDAGVITTRPPRLLTHPLRGVAA